MILNDERIRDLCTRDRSHLVVPFRDRNVQPASYDLALGGLEKGRGIEGLNFIWPLEFRLCHTEEVVSLPDNIAGAVWGKSSLGRMGLIVHTAGWVDPGFSGQLVLELFNCSRQPVELKIGQKIAQIAFHLLINPALYPYGSPNLGSHYQNQRGVTK